MTSNFEYYKIFYYVAKYGNLTRAAAALNTSQPAVTRVIHKLEADLGCRLFIRSKSGMELTAEGSRFFEYVSAGCLQFFRAESHLSDLLQLENGSISISATETALHSWLFEAMENFHEEYPGVHFQILNHSTQDSIQAVRDGKVDFAVVSSLPLHISEPLRMKKLHTYRDILISGKRFSELKGHPVSLRELASYPWISLTSESISRTFKHLLWCSARTSPSHLTYFGHHRPDSARRAPQLRDRVHPGSLRPQRTRRRKHLPDPGTGAVSGTKHPADLRLRISAERGIESFPEIRERNSFV